MEGSKWKQESGGSESDYFVTNVLITQKVSPTLGR
jgi:hypothetical protein